MGLFNGGPRGESHHPYHAHREVSGGWLRPAVFGAMDGLVSNFSLVLGMAGAGSSSQVVLLAGLAGLLAGALSMAAGEYISVRSQRELLDAATHELDAATLRALREHDAGELDAAGFEIARRRLQRFDQASAIVVPSEAIRARADRLLGLHTLRAADAFQLAALLAAAEERPAELPFVTLDGRLADAARREGFSVLPG